MTSSWHLAHWLSNQAGHTVPHNAAWVTKEQQPASERPMHYGENSPTLPAANAGLKLLLALAFTVVLDLWEPMAQSA